MYIQKMYTKGVIFEWDPKKDKENIAKHSISFDEAKTVFFDPLAKIAADPDHSADEQRFIIAGHSVMSRLVLVVHCFREDDSTIRIISARKLTKAERKQYEDGL